jgi:hypothetical protein
LPRPIREAAFSIPPEIARRFVKIVELPIFKEVVKARPVELLIPAVTPDLHPFGARVWG